MESEQLLSIKLRAEKALTKWMRWEVENNDPSPDMDDLYQIMADILLERAINVLRRAGPGRPPKAASMPTQDLPRAS